MHGCGADATAAGVPRKVRAAGRTTAIAMVFVAALVAVLLAVSSEGASARRSGRWSEAVVTDTTIPLVVSIDFDPPNGARRSDPAMYTSFDAYVILEGANPGNLPGGMRTLTLRLAVSAGMSSPPHFESLLPGRLVVGGWRDGIMLASSPCSAEDPIVIGVLHLFYLGQPGVVTVLDHPDFPRWVVDCEDEAHMLEIGSPGGVHRDPPPAACGAPTGGVGPGGEEYGSDGEGEDAEAGGDAGTGGGGEEDEEGGGDEGGISGVPAGG